MLHNKWEGTGASKSRVGMKYHRSLRSLCNGTPCLAELKDTRTRFTLKIGDTIPLCCQRSCRPDATSLNAESREYITVASIYVLVYTSEAVSVLEGYEQMNGEIDSSNG
jgi:hypothetical protein